MEKEDRLRFKKILEAFPGWGKEHFWEYVEVGEFQLAIEMFSIALEDKPITQEIFDELQDLAKGWNVDHERFIECLRENITNPP